MSSIIHKTQNNQQKILINRDGLYSVFNIIHAGINERDNVIFRINNK